VKFIGFFSFEGPIVLGTDTVGPFHYR